MVLDVRAQILCNLGPVISGSVKDDHVQGQGLVTTTGELVIAGLITPAHGNVVKLGYITPDGTTVARFPRGPFYVTKAFADPLANQTQVSIADKLAFEKNKGGGVVNSALVDALNGREPKVAKTMNLREAFSVIANRVGIQVQNAGNWNLTKQITALTSSDYVETLSDMLASVTRFGHLNGQNKLVTYSYKELPKKGPVVGFDQVVDLAGNQGGLDFSENPTGSGSAQTVDKKEEPPPTTFINGPVVTSGSYGSFSSDWSNSATSTQTTIKVNLKNGSTVSFPVTETVITSENKAEPDNRTLERTTLTQTSLVKVNSQVIQDYLNAGFNYGPSPSTPITSRKTDSYIYEEIPPPPLTKQEQEQRDQEIEAAIDALSQSTGGLSPLVRRRDTIVLLPELPTFRPIREQNTETMSYVEALGRIGVKDYTKMNTLPTGEGIKQVIITDILYSHTKQKRVERTYVAYGLTQMGQQAISAAAVKASTGSSLIPYIDQFFDLVLEDCKIITTDLNLPQEEKPVPDYLAPFQFADAVIQGISRIQVGQQEQQRANNSNSFTVPFLPDDVVNDDGTVTKGGASTAAANYAEDQNRLLLGHRLGLQVTTALGVLPTQPLGAFHLRNGGITATYRTNGTVWTFDANSCLVSTDALYWGLAGGDVNGPRWTPVAPGTSALPIPPADVDNGPQAPVNSLTLVSEFISYDNLPATPEEAPEAVSDYGLITAAVTTQLDYGLVTALAPPDESDPVELEAVLNALPDDGTEVFELELTPEALALPYKPITETALQVRLQLEQLLVPLGINRTMGDAAAQLVLQVKAQQEVAEQVVVQVESAERQLLIQAFNYGLGLGGNLS